MTDWSTADIPRQNGRIAVITGATGGLGYETALALAGAGAMVVLTGRNDAKGRNALAQIRSRVPNARISYETADGFEMQFGINYLGHYALTARLLPQLRRGNAPRVVNLSSLAHRSGAINFDDLQARRSYSPWRTYCQSKLAMLLFALELQRRSNALGWGLMSNAAHPGYARTDLIPNGPGGDSLQWRVGRYLQPYISQSAAAGALPTLFAATSPQAEAAGYYGPNWFYELKGAPVPAKIMPQAKDAAVAARLWDISAELTHVSFDQVAAAA